MTKLELIEAAIATVSGISFVYGMARPLDSLAGQKYLAASVVGFLILALLVANT